MLKRASYSLAKESIGLKQKKFRAIMRIEILDLKNWRKKTGSGQGERY
jgi:hypothetical protein